MSNITLPAAVESFIAATTAHDPQAWNTVFSDDASVTDDGKTYVGDDDIREWVQGHLVDPKIVITPTSFEGNRLVASCDGDFPGPAQSFAFVFDIKNDQIADLDIDHA